MGFRGEENMQSKITPLKARVLIHLFRMGKEGGTVTHLADQFGVAKSTVSRAIGWCEKNNLIQQPAEGRKIILSVKGRALAEKYQHRFEIVRQWLVSKGVSCADAERDAMSFILNLSDASADILYPEIKLCQIRKKLLEQEKIKGKDFCEALEDGRYPVGFMFCRCRDSCGLSESWLNDVFEHPGELVINNKTGIIILRVSNPGSYVSSMNGLQIDQTIQSIRYIENGQLQNTGKKEGYFYFPVHILEFLHYEDHRFLQGTVAFKLSCTAGSVAMPEMEAIFTMYF